MGGAVMGGRTARIRIKGHWQSVLRFFFISIGYMMTWVLVTSELSYYAKWLGPQILLQLNFAFYIPSIPVLLITGQLEKFLDRRFGPIQSMAIRLHLGLAGNLAICALFPFTTGNRHALLWTTVLLGTVSSVAFSTSYQLVQWFRHADIIALGIGNVGSGPLVLLVQLGLAQLEGWPARWQWVAMFEISAAIILIGFISSVSLFSQYWSIMTGAAEVSTINSIDAAAAAVAAVKKAEEAASLTTPLLDRQDLDPEAGPVRIPGLPSTSSGPPTSGGGAARSFTPSARRRSYCYNVREGAFSPQDHEEERYMALAMAPTSNNIIIAPDSGMPFLFHAPGELHPAGSWESSTPTLVSRRSAPLLGPSGRSPTAGGGGGFSPPRRRAPSPAPAHAQKWPGSGGGGLVHFDEPSMTSLINNKSPSKAGWSSPFASSSPGALHGQLAKAAADGGLPCSTRAPSSDLAALAKADRGAGAAPAAYDAGEAAGGDGAGAAAGGGAAGGGGEDPSLPPDPELKTDAELSFWQESTATIAKIWTVLVAFLIAVTVLYTVRHECSTTYMLQ